MLNFRLEAAVTLVAKGQPASVIVLAERPTQSAQLAAREIQCHNKLPQPGQEWGLNIYCNKPAGGGSTAWSRTFGMWHVINRFGAVKFSQ
jgi:hypothetical protein